MAETGAAVSVARARAPAICATLIVVVLCVASGLFLALSGGVVSGNDWFLWGCSR